MRRAVAWGGFEGIAVTGTPPSQREVEFSGSLLAHSLRSQGRKVRNSTEAARRPPLGRASSSSPATSATFDVSRACDGIDTVFQHGAQVPLARDKELFQSVNVAGTETLLASCEDLGVRKVVYTSSSAVFGVADHNPVRRDPRSRRRSTAAPSTRASCSARRRQPRPRRPVVRPRTIVAARGLGTFAILLTGSPRSWASLSWALSDNRYQFVHAEDLASACILAGRREGPATYNIGAERFGTMREALEHLCEYAGTGARVRSLPVGPTSMDEGSGLRTTRGVGHRFDPLGRAKTEEDFRSVAGHLLTGIKEDAFTVTNLV